MTSRHCNATTPHARGNLRGARPLAAPSGVRHVGMQAAKLPSEGGGRLLGCHGVRRSRIWRNARLAVRNARAIRDKRGLAIGAAHRDRRSSARGHCSSSKKKTRRPHALPFLCRTRCPPWTDRASLSQACRSRRTRETWATNHGAKHEKHVRGGLQPITTFVLRASSCVRGTLCGGRQHREASDSGGTYRGGFARQPGDAHRAIVCSPAGPPPRCLQSARAARAQCALLRAPARARMEGGGVLVTH